MGRHRPGAEIPQHLCLRAAVALVEAWPNASTEEQAVRRTALHALAQRVFDRVRFFCLSKPDVLEYLLPEALLGAQAAGVTWDELRARFPSGGGGATVNKQKMEKHYGIKLDDDRILAAARASPIPDDFRRLLRACRTSLPRAYAG